jgi:hypothetical protein
MPELHTSPRVALIVILLAAILGLIVLAAYMH